MRIEQMRGGDAMNENDAIIRTVLASHPTAQAIYLFGTYGTEYARADSDVDIAVLLPPAHAKAVGLMAMSDLRFTLEALLKRAVDLINLRRVPTVLQKEVIVADRRIYCADQYAADEFDMLTLSYYQKLNEERAEIIRDALATGRIVA